MFPCLYLDRNSNVTDDPMFFVQTRVCMVLRSFWSLWPHWIQYGLNFLVYWRRSLYNILTMLILHFPEIKWSPLFGAPRKGNDTKKNTYIEQAPIWPTTFQKTWSLKRFVITPLFGWLEAFANSKWSCSSR